MNNLNRYAFHPIAENPIVLNFSECETMRDIHELLKRKFGFHECYGANWDALWDCMRDVFEDESYMVEIHSFYSLNEELQKECGMLLEIFDRVAKNCHGFSYKIIY